MITLYNSVRTSSGSSDALPSMPMFEYDLLTTIKALELVKRSLESYLNEVSTHFCPYAAHLPRWSAQGICSWKRRFDVGCIFRSLVIGSTDVFLSWFNTDCFATDECTRIAVMRIIGREERASRIHQEHISMVRRSPRTNSIYSSNHWPFKVPASIDRCRMKVIVPFTTTSHSPQLARRRVITHHHCWCDPKAMIPREKWTHGYRRRHHHHLWSHRCSYPSVIMTQTFVVINDASTIRSNCMLLQSHHWLETMHIDKGR